MTISTKNLRQHLQAFDLKRLFIEELGWNNYTSRLQPFELDGIRYSFTPIATHGMVIVQCESGDGNIPSTGARRKIDKYITDLVYEHIIIFVDGDKSTALWQWVKREDGKSKPRTYTYRKGQLADALLQKLAGIAFEIDELDDDGKASIAVTTEKVKKAWDVETITKKFYDQFKIEHSIFLKFLKDIQDTAGRDWYASVILNRLMFLYFIQRKYFLNNDPDYLRHQLEAIEAADRDYFHDFLLKLFFDGLACEESERTAEVNQLLGKVPYLNGGLFLPHEIEEKHKKVTPGDQIAIPNEAFVNLFNFFDSWNWHLDVREHRAGNEINPDVLGYIFEKYINAIEPGAQANKGAYYTKEDITGYICKNTILPFLLNKVAVDVQAVMRDVEPYIYDAVGTVDYLPMETEREYIARRKNYEQIKADFAAGKIVSVNDLVTYNLDIMAFTEDWLRGLDDSSMLGSFYFDCLTKLTVLDPTCGSGAFLFAAMNILEPLYELALDKMRRFADPVSHLKFLDELERVDDHHNRRYFVFKSIIVKNLYGVDIMPEAVEICKLRLFLKLVAQIDDPNVKIEPLPDIDFNIQSGNTLVGFAIQSEISGRLFATPALIQKVKEADRALSNFRELQTRLDKDAKASDTDQSERLSRVLKKAKKDIHIQLNTIRDTLDHSLMEDYGQNNLAAFRKSHQPFHWYVEFNHVIANGGFDVIVGNPPYVEYEEVKGTYTVKNLQTEKTGNLYAYVVERVLKTLKDKGLLGVIIPVASVCTDGYTSLQKLLRGAGSLVISNFNDRPSKLFENLEHIRLSIILSSKDEASTRTIHTTKYHKWQSVERPTLFENLRFTDTTKFAIDGSIPKLSSPIEHSILNKLRLQHRTIGYFVSKKKVASIYYTRKLSGFVQILDFIPEMLDAQGEKRVPSELKEITFEDAVVRNAWLAVLNSNLFYWYLTIYSDCRNLNKREIYMIPFDINSATIQTKNDLSGLSQELMQDLRSNSRLATVNYKKWGMMTIQNIFPKYSKPIIDQVDTVLARHFAFTDEELDFIINYDIKYRLGKDTESDDAEADDA